MSARRTKVRTAVPAVELVRATCVLCSAPRALCASLRDVDAPTCFDCTLSMAQFIAAAKRASERPHDRPCTCESCGTFDQGQRGEIASARLLDEERVELSRWSVLEVD